MKCFYRINRNSYALLMGIVLAMITSFQVRALELPGPLVQPDWLEKHLDQVLILDVRADVKSFSKRSKSKSPVNPCGAGIKGKAPKVVAGHIPGATLVRWSLLTAQKKVGGQKLDGWLPKQEDFQQLMQRSGLNRDSLVVITGKGKTPIQTAMAARLYLTLRFFGHDQAALLDGGTAAWIHSGRDVKFGSSRAKRGNFEAAPGKEKWIATLSQVESSIQAGDRQLLDNRKPAAYLGLSRHLKEVADKWKGHIPTAKNLPLSYLANSVGPSAKVFDTETIQKVASSNGIDVTKPTTVYCNSGVMASLGWFVLHEVLGNQDVLLYNGSAQEWVAAKKPLKTFEADSP